MQRKERLEVKAIELPDSGLWRKKLALHVNSEFWIFLKGERDIPFNHLPPSPILLKLFVSDS